MDIIKMDSEISIDFETFAVACEYMDNHLPTLSAEALETSFNMVISALMLWDCLSLRSDNQVQFPNEKEEIISTSINRVMSNPTTKFVEDFITGRNINIKSYREEEISCLNVNYLSNPLTTTQTNIPLNTLGFDRRTALYPVEKNLKAFYDELDAKFGKKKNN